MSTQWNRNGTFWAAFGLLLAALMTAGCSTSTSAANAPPAFEVEVATVQQRDVPIYREWIGTLDGMVNAAIKAQVSGYLRSQNYAEGSFVRKGQLLFEIDQRPFQATLDQAQGQLAQANGQLAQANAQLLQSKAQLASAEANQRKAQLDEDRYTPLVKQQAITQQDMDNATQGNLAAKAQVEAARAQVETAKAQIQAAAASVEAAKAAVETARVNFGFTHLISPIDGIAGAAKVQVGNLVNPAADAVTTVSTLDPIKATFTVGEQEYLSLTRDATRMSRLQLELILADGTTYANKGKFYFADREVNASTGSIQLTALFPNPGNVLRPGQYAKVRTAVSTLTAALLVPQPAITELQGSYQAAIVDSANRVDIQTVKVGDRVGSLWVVSEGLKPGQRVVTRGLQKIRPGMVVNPKDATDAPEVEGR